MFQINPNNPILDLLKMVWGGQSSRQEEEVFVCLFCFAEGFHTLIKINTSMKKFLFNTYCVLGTILGREGPRIKLSLSLKSLQTKN